MFGIVRQTTKRVKFPLVYAGMLDHDDFDNITNFQFLDGSQHQGGHGPSLLGHSTTEYIFTASITVTLKQQSNVYLLPLIHLVCGIPL
jgi:hypothetical protein